MSELLHICLSLKGKLVKCWGLLQQIANGLSNVKQEEIHNIHLLVLKNLANEHLTDEKLLMFEALLDAELGKLN